MQVMGMDNIILLVFQNISDISNVVEQSTTPESTNDIDHSPKSFYFCQIAVLFRTFIDGKIKLDTCPVNAPVRVHDNGLNTTGNLKAI